MKRTDITRTIVSLLITAAMLGVTGCGNVNTDTSSAPPKATTTASSTEASATTTTEATLTSRSEETSLSATTTSSTTSASTSSGKSSTTTKGGTTTKSNSPQASNGGTVNNQSYSHSTANNGSGNNSYSNDNNNSYQPQQTERQTTTTRQTTTAKKTQAPKPKPTTTTTAKPKFKLTQNDIDRAKRELQAYSRTLSHDYVYSLYEECGYSSPDDFYELDESTSNLDNSSWGTPDTVSPDTYSSYDELYQKVRGHIDVLYKRIKYDSHVVVYVEWHGDGSAINSDGKPAWEIYLLY
ncbi:hypothetical protein [Ruminococcus sp.]|uniref:hypothetical protein n=2 Tax=Ruminococcus sp. TaxID=41978 RepID=UPI003FD804C3